MKKPPSFVLLCDYSNRRGTHAVFRDADWRFFDTPVEYEITFDDERLHEAQVFGHDRRPRFGRVAATSAQCDRSGTRETADIQRRH